MKPTNEVLRGWVESGNVGVGEMATELLAKRAECERYRNALLEIRDWVSCTSQAIRVAEQALTTPPPSRKPNRKSK